MTKPKNEATGAPRKAAKRGPKGQGRAGSKKAGKAGMGASPLDRLTEEPSPLQEEPEATKKTPETSRKAGKDPKPPKGKSAKRQKKQKVTYLIPPDLVDALRNAALFCGGHPAYLNLSRIVENGLRAELRKLEKKYNGGEPFPQRPHDLVGGRPAGS